MVYCYSELITLSQWITSHTLAIQVIRSPLGFHNNRAALKLKKTNTSKKASQSTNKPTKQTKPTTIKLEKTKSTTVKLNSFLGGEQCNPGLPWQQQQDCSDCTGCFQEIHALHAHQSAF